jgi:hypothetical protein
VSPSTIPEQPRPVAAEPQGLPIAESDSYPYRGRPEPIRRQWNTCDVCRQTVTDLWEAVVIDDRGTMVHRACWGRP